MPGDFVKVARSDDLADGQMTLVTVGNQDILLARINGNFFAIGNWCPHALGQLDQGELIGFEVECPLHSGRFDVRTGEPTCEPADVPVASFAVRVEGQDVLVGPATDSTPEQQKGTL
jgi:nitrite reductase/ring-hydroxylating ferredoxin subunit